MNAQVIQLSDFHLNKNRRIRYKELFPAATLTKVLESIRQRFSHADCFVLTGDLAHDETMDTYWQLRDLLAELVPCCYIIPGNHDNPSAIRTVFPENIQTHSSSVSFAISLAGWRLIGLDSFVPGEVYGRIDESQLEWLVSQLREHAKEPTILFVHHPPVSVGSPWLDQIGLKDPQYLLEILSGSSQVRATFTGHIHQEFNKSYRGRLQIFGAPSTSVQFLPKTQKPVIDRISPGFRVIDLDGMAMATRIIRVPI